MSNIRHSTEANIGSKIGSNLFAHLQLGYWRTLEEEESLDLDRIDLREMQLNYLEGTQNKKKGCAEIKKKKVRNRKNNQGKTGKGQNRRR